MKLKDFNIWQALLLIAILYILFNKNCGNSNVDINQRDTISSITTTKVEYDTVYLPQDTIYVAITQDIKYDTVYVNNGTDISVESSTIYEDSLIWAEVKAYSKTPVDSFKYEYKPKFPIYITKTITNNTETVLEEKAKFQLYTGILTGGSAESFKFGPLVHFKSRRDIIYTAGYDILQKEVNLGIAFKISFKRNK